MAMFFADAISDAEATDAAVGQVVDTLLATMAGRPIDWLFIAATGHHVPQFRAINDHLHDVLSPASSLGVTAMGVLGANREIEQAPGLAVLAGSLPGVTIWPFTYDQLDWPDVADDPHALREALLGGAVMPNPSLVVMLADPFSTPMSRLLPAMNTALPAVPFVGGMASAGQSAGDNRLILNGRIHQQGAVGLIFTGQLDVRMTLSQGCRPIGEPWVVTSARKNLIMELGGQPAMEVIHETAANLDADNRELLDQGLLIGRVINEYKSHFGRGDFLIRNVIGFDHERRYIAVSDFFNVGQTIQFHVRDKRTAEEDLRLLLGAQRLHDDPAGLLLCSCNGRGRHMYGQPNRETRIITDELGRHPMAGFFGAGEIGPIGQQNFVHGFTASLAAFRPPAPSPDDGE